MTRFRHRLRLLVCLCAMVLSGAEAQPPRAKAEPERGCYFSAFVGPDLSVRTEMFARGGTLTDAVGRLAGKPIAVEWLYFNYNNPREVEGYLRGYKKHPSVLEVALEPNGGLQEVTEDSVREYARMMGNYGRPLFLRFASEMNGNWTRYHANPAAYRSKFRMVHHIMSKLAPNVVMVWCVSDQPSKNWDDYYPGDAFVDWVGVDFYSVLHHNNDPKQSAENESISSHLDAIYRKYASRKPIAICEYGASHQEKLNPAVDRSDWAAARFTELLTLLPKRYPRIKLVGLFNVNTMQNGFQSAGARANNFCFTNSPTILTALKQCLASDYYLSRVAESRSTSSNVP